jgi:hypothetical protein
MPAVIIRGFDQVAWAIARQCRKEGYPVVLTIEGLPEEILAGSLTAAVRDKATNYGDERLRHVDSATAFAASDSTIGVYIGKVAELLTAGASVLVDARMTGAVPQEDYLGMDPLTIGIGKPFATEESEKLSYADITFSAYEARNSECLARTVVACIQGWAFRGRG